MKFTYKHSAILLIIYSFLFVSCSDSFLDRQSLVAMSERDFWKTEQDAKSPRSMLRWSTRSIPV